MKNLLYTGFVCFAAIINIEEDLIIPIIDDEGVTAKCSKVCKYPAARSEMEKLQIPVP